MYHSHSIRDRVLPSVRRCNKLNTRDVADMDFFGSLGPACKEDKTGARTDLKDKPAQSRDFRRK